MFLLNNEDNITFEREEVVPIKFHSFELRIFRELGSYYVLYFFNSFILNPLDIPRNVYNNK